ncbi:MAG: hypothetical protein VXW80_04960, partial [Candidatus Thermoplasmatota archaeon]|nr:hypothetical protein [Candidatus Thermoplasmatota archaeon]
KSKASNGIFSGTAVYFHSSRYGMKHLLLIPYPGGFNIHVWVVFHIFAKFCIQKIPLKFFIRMPKYPILTQNTSLDNDRIE